MKPFLNKTVLEKKHFNEINSQIFLKTPLYVVLYIVCILSIITRLIDLFVYNVVNLTAIIPFVLALAAMVAVYFSTSRSQYRQNFHNDEPIAFEFKVDGNGIFVNTSSGASKTVAFNEIYKTFESKSCFCVRCRDNSFFIIRKDGFLKGEAEQFSKLLKDVKKGIDPVFAIEEDV